MRITTLGMLGLLVSQHEEVYKMLGVVPGTEQALRHSSYILIHHVNTHTGFLPKIRERGNDPGRGGGWCYDN